MVTPLKIGAACVYLDADGTRSREKNFVGTTVKALTAMSAEVRIKWLTQLLSHNLDALDQQIACVAALPEQLRMWRLSADMLPIPTHEVTENFYRNPYIRFLLQTRLAKTGAAARAAGIRLSFHPGQYVVLGSQTQRIRNNAVRELDLHAWLFTKLGYTERHQDGCAINVHVGPKVAAVKAMRRLIINNPDIARFMTLENDEFSWSAQAIVDNFGDLVPVVLDVHHYWIMHERRIRPTNPLVAEIRETWHGIRPKIHHAMSSPDLCGEAPQEKLISIHPLLASGVTKSALRAHSQSPWHRWSNEYATMFKSDIMWEGKDKNLGALAIHKQVTHLL